MDWTKRILAKVGLSPGYPDYFPSDLAITPESNVLKESFKLHLIHASLVPSNSSN